MNVFHVLWFTQDTDLIVAWQYGWIEVRQHLSFYIHLAVTPRHSKVIHLPQFTRIWDSQEWILPKARIIAPEGVSHFVTKTVNFTITLTTLNPKFEVNVKCTTAYNIKPTMASKAVAHYMSNVDTTTWSVISLGSQKTRCIWSGPFTLNIHGDTAIQLTMPEVVFIPDYHSVSSIFCHCCAIVWCGI